MHPRILSPLEERQIKTFLKADGEKDVNMRVLAHLAKKNLPGIKADLQLLENLLQAYAKETRAYRRKRLSQETENLKN